MCYMWELIPQGEGTIFGVVWPPLRGLSAAKGVVGLHSAGKSDIYDCFVAYERNVTVS